MIAGVWMNEVDLPKPALCSGLKKWQQTEEQNGQNFGEITFREKISEESLN